MQTVIERPDGTKRVQIVFDKDDPRARSRTKPEFAKDCDINVMMSRYQKTGIIGDPLMYKEGTYGDFSGGGDFMATMNRVVSARQSFEQLPAKIRNKFNNDPAQFLDFVQNEDNREDCIELGLIAKPVIKTVRELAQDGKEYAVTTKDGVEIKRVPVVKADAPPSA